MANNNLTGNEDILVKVDQNNLIYIDPNTVVDNEGNVQPRAILQENLVTYVNLEADIIPRTILAASNDKLTMTSIAKGTLSFLGNNGKNYDTTWTDTYLNVTENSSTGDKTNNSSPQNKTSQSLGIQSISILVKGANFVPQVNINFIDVRGKTLFEAPDDSPYNAFFHLPWPIFYLTVKGYYGQAIRYRLHLVKFTSKFNENNGNFEITTNFVGSTYAFMNDIPLKGILNAPYMYAYDNEPIGQQTYNSQTQQYNVPVKQSSRGYQLLNSVYAEYKAQGLLAPDFPVKTLKEIVMTAKTLDKVLERSLFGGGNNGLDPRILQSLKQMGEVIEKFQNDISSWRATNTITSGYTSTNNVFYSYLSGTIDDKKSTKKIYNPNATTQTNTTLEYKIFDYNKQIKNINAQFDEIAKQNPNLPKININTVDVVNSYVIPSSNNGTSSIPGGLVGVAITKLLNDINGINNTFSKEKQNVQKYLEKKINDVFKNPSLGLGFEPTLRNIFAVIMANADVYVRLMKETHQRAFDVGEERKKIIKDYCIEAKNNDNIYPWPEIRKKNADGKQQVIAYPGEADLQNKLSSTDKRLWPEVDFLENYYKITTLMVDPNGVKESTSSNVNFVFPDNGYIKNVKGIGAASTLYFTVPYLNQTPSSFLYEIWERAYYFSLYDSFNVNTIRELADLEFGNIKNMIVQNGGANDDNIELINILKERVNTVENLQVLLSQFSPFDRYPYYNDQLPTIPFFTNVSNQPFKLQQYISTSATTNNDTSYVNLNNWLNNYIVEDYRKNIYPFSSSLYQTYLTNKSFYDVKGIFSVNTNDGLITAPINPYIYVKDEFISNLFNQKINNGNTNINILNTPYFHNQLFSDFNNPSNYGKYVGSAYLLLNSLPFYDLNDDVSFGTKNLVLSSMFREVGVTNFIPYHLIIKWGSIYHRYKNYIKNGTDILSGFLDTNNKTQPINQSVFFDNETNQIFYVPDSYDNSFDDISYSGATDIGIHPFYDAIFSQIVNGYSHYDITQGSSSFDNNVVSGGIIEYNTNNPNNSLRYWTQLMNNSRYGDGTDLRYTILPSCALNSMNPTDTFNTSNEFYMRILWNDFTTNEYVNDSFTGITFPSYSENLISTDNTYSLTENYKKVIDLIGTFSPDILNEFESMFLDFASDIGVITNEETPNPKFYNTSYTHFQNLLKDIVSFTGVTNNNDLLALINSIKTIQSETLKQITGKILSTDNLVKFTLANPKELDSHVLNGFAKTSLTNTLMKSIGKFYSSQATQINLNYIKLYIGEDIDGYYLAFFENNDIELNESNVLLFRPLILIYGGFMNTHQAGTFSDYIKNEIILKTNGNVDGFNNRFINFLSILISNFGSLSPSQSKNDQPINIVGGYNSDPIKVDMYNNFKSFNDKWVAGNSLGQRSLIEEFLFLDRANKDIGDEFYIDIQKLIPICDERNKDINLYEAVSTLIQNSGLDMRPLPAYVNFYGTNYNNKSKTSATRKTATDLFGTFLDVNYQDASPKIVIQYVGDNSKYLANGSKDNKFNDDSFNCSMVNNNPLLITTSQALTLGDLTKSNKVVSFEVSFGDQNQGIFKSLQLDQSTLRNTAASAYVLENLARSESGANANNIDISLYDYYRTAAYSCEVKMLGNVMIQPTMFFYLKNVPMFKGSYWITEVSHDIKNNSVMTTFKGARVPIGALPNPKDSFAASYKTLFDKLTNQAIDYLKLKPVNPSTAEVILDNVLGPVVYDAGTLQKWENKNIFMNNNAGKTAYGVPFNGGGIGTHGKYVQHIKYNGTNWLRANVIMMDDKNYAGRTMDIISLLSNDSFTITWEDLKKATNYNLSYFFSLNYEFFDNTTAVSADSYYPLPSRGGIMGTFYNANPNLKLNKRAFITEYTYSTIDNKKTLQRITGPVSKFVPDGYGIALSPRLMSDLKLSNGDYVYFDVDNNQIINGTQNLSQ